jgi:predicted RNase H-like nuclease (RuvC/YqgF family)
MAVALDAGQESSNILSQQLMVLNKEVAALNDKLDRAYEDCEAAQSDQDRDWRRQKVADLMSLMQGKEGRRAALESKLAGVWGAVIKGAEYCASTCNRCA